MKQLSTLLFAALLAGCASGPAPMPPAQHLYSDSAFKLPDDYVSPSELFALSPEMKDYVAKVRQNLHGANAHEALFTALYRRDQLRLEYDSELTRTAAQAFRARAGNCLSLVIMTAALARELDLTVQFQKVAVEDSWSRSGNLYFSNGHVNLVLSKGMGEVGQYDRAKMLTIDFLPPEDADRLDHDIIPEKTIVAMFMNNRAAEALVHNKLDNAYWWARNALEQDPNFLHAYNTLAIVYERHGDLVQSEKVLRTVLMHEPKNIVTLSNLAHVLGAQGRTEDALAVKTELERIEPHPPFYYFHKGQKAMQAGDFRSARTLFAREVEREPFYHEFHFWLAKAAFELGDLSTADKHMRLALSNSTTNGDSALYAGKLDRLRSYENKVRLRPETSAN